MKRYAIHELGTLGDIAKDLNVEPTRVCNWRTRYATFPQPVATYGKTAVFDRAEVIEWAHTDRTIITMRKAVMS